MIFPCVKQANTQIHKYKNKLTRRGIIMTITIAITKQNTMTINITMTFTGTKTMMPGCPCEKVQVESSSSCKHVNTEKSRPFKEANQLLDQDDDDVALQRGQVQIHY